MPFVPPGYTEGDILLMPVYVSSPLARVPQPNGWSLVNGLDHTPFELETEFGFITAFWRIAEDVEEPEVTLESDDLEAEIIGQILVLGVGRPYGSGTYGVGFYGDNRLTGWAQPVATHGLVSVAGEDSPGESPGSIGSSAWETETVEAIDIRAQDAVVALSVAPQEITLSDDQVGVGTPTFGITYGELAEVDSVFTGQTYFRTTQGSVESGVGTSTVAYAASSTEPASGVVVLFRLRPSGGDEVVPVFTSALLPNAEKRGQEVFHVREGINRQLFAHETVGIREAAIPFIDEFSIVFNQSRKTPGFTITLRGLLDFEHIEVLRRDPSGYYGDTVVRGLADVDVTGDDLQITDYEAPLQTPLDYYIRLTVGETSGGPGGTFTYGPIRPLPESYIPMLYDAYGAGTAFLTPVDVPELGQALQLDSDGLNSWDRPARILAEHEILGRENKLIISDVLGGKQGTITGHAVLRWGQSVKDIEAMLRPGATMLLRTHNPQVVGFDDFYLKVTGAVGFDRHSRVVHYGSLSNPAIPEVILTFSFNFTEQDRPDPVGEVVVTNPWESLFLRWPTCDALHAALPTCLALLKTPLGPLEES